MYSLPEGSMSQKFDFGPSYFFLVCRNLGKDFVALLFTFYF